VERDGRGVEELCEIVVLVFKATDDVLYVGHTVNKVDFVNVPKLQATVV
jgi:hypothetical protein